MHPIEQDAQLLGVTPASLRAGIASGRVRTERLSLSGEPRYIPSYELARLRELAEHAAWRRRHRDDAIQRLRR